MVAKWMLARYTKIMSRPPSYLVLRDLGILALSLIIAILLAYSGTIPKILDSLGNVALLGGFLAGLCYTSIFTTAPAVVALGQIAQTNSLLETAFVGAIGAVLGDYFLFSFVRDSLSPHLTPFLHALHTNHLRRFFSRGPLRIVPPLAGAAIIASPLPDEFGLVFLGFSKTKTALFVPLSFLANFIGILAIGLIARSIL